jgi:hypothetical protein
MKRALVCALASGLVCACTAEPRGGMSVFRNSRSSARDSRRPGSGVSQRRYGVAGVVGVLRCAYRAARDPDCWTLHRRPYALGGARRHPIVHVHQRRHVRLERARRDGDQSPKPRHRLYPTITKVPLPNGALVTHVGGMNNGVLTNALYAATGVSRTARRPGTRSTT